MSQETIYCEYCKQRFDIRGYQGHIRSKKHIRALHLAEKKAKRKAELEKQSPIETEDKQTEAVEEPQNMEVVEPAPKEPKSTQEETEEPEDIEDLDELEEPEIEQEVEQEDKYMTIRIIDGKESKPKSAGLDKLIDMLATPETIAIIGQVLGQIVASKVQTQPVAAPKWGYDDKGNAIEF